MIMNNLPDSLVADFDNAWEQESEKDVSLATLQLLLGSVDSNLSTPQGDLYTGMMWGSHGTDIPGDNVSDSTGFLQSRSSTEDDGGDSIGTFTSPSTPSCVRSSSMADAGSEFSEESFISLPIPTTSENECVDESSDNQVRQASRRPSPPQHTTVQQLQKLKLLLKKEEFKLSWLLSNFEAVEPLYRKGSSVQSEETYPSQQPEATAEAKAKQEKRRLLIVQEILETEENYIEALDTLLKVYKRPIEITANTNNPILPEKYHKTIFFCVEEIMGLHLKLRDKVASRLDNWSNEQKIGDVFISLGNMYQAYLEFTNNYSKALSIIRLSRTEFPVFAEFCDDVALKLKSNRKRHNLHDLMVMPIQRIPRYLLLLEALAKNTSREHSDRVDIASAIKAAKEIAVYINEGQRRAESVEKVYNMDQRISGFIQPVFSSERYHILEQNIVDYTDKKRKWMLLILLNDYIVCAKKIHNSRASTKEAHYKHVWSCPLENTCFSKGTSTDVRFDKVMVINLQNDIKTLQREMMSGAPPKTNTLDRMRNLTASVDNLKGTFQNNRKREMVLLKDSLALNSPQQQLNIEIMSKKSGKTSKKVQKYTYLLHTAAEVNEWMERVMNLQRQLGSKSHSDESLLKDEDTLYNSSAKLNHLQPRQ
eukprot:CFRG5594T1